jgi:membrane associated rhomboid family serine protease
LIPLRDNIPSDNFPVATAVIIAINVVVFLFFQGPSFSFSGGDAVKTEPVVEFGAIPYRVTNPGKACDLVPAEATTANVDTPVCEGTPEYEEARAAGVVEDLNEPPAFLTIFTSMFMHGGWLHIIFNMLFLWIFGNNIEDAMGRVRYVLFYLLGGVAAAGAQVAVSPDSTVPLVGASGAIAAVLGGYALLYPFARVLTLFFAFFIFILEIPALVMLGVWIALQFLPAVGQLATPELGDGGGVAYFAHIGGFVFGLAAVHLFAVRRSSRYGGREPKYPVY